MLGDLFYHLGTALGGIGTHLPGKHGAATHSHHPDDPDFDDLEPDGDDLYDPGDLLRGAGATWLITRLLRPRPVSWTRVVLAGVAATALAELVARTLERDRRPVSVSRLNDPEEVMARVGAGVAIAAGYASVLYPRLPGSPLARGLAFGALEIAAAQRGGLARLASELPGIRFPLQPLALPVDEDAGPLSHLAFGLGLGLFYRYEEEEEE